MGLSPYWNSAVCIFLGAEEYLPLTTKSKWIQRWRGCIRRRRGKWLWVAAYSSSAVCSSAWELICRLLTWLLNRSGWRLAGKSWEIIWRSDTEIDADAGFQTPIIGVRVLSLFCILGRDSFAFCSILMIPVQILLLENNFKTFNLNKWKWYYKLDEVINFCIIIIPYLTA